PRRPLGRDRAAPPFSRLPAGRLRPPRLPPGRGRPGRPGISPVKPQQILEILQGVATGALTPEQALGDLAELPYADLGFAKLDFHRELRNGHPEAVYGEGKTPADLERIVERMLVAHGRALVTRLKPDAAERLRERWPQAAWHERARI